MDEGGENREVGFGFLLSLRDKRFTATQYALLSSLMAMSRVLAGVPTGFMAKGLGWPMFFSVSVLGAVPGIWLLTRCQEYFLIYN